jgi:hypothetical protein
LHLLEYPGPLDTGRQAFQCIQHHLAARQSHPTMSHL